MQISKNKSSYFHISLQSDLKDNLVENAYKVSTGSILEALTKSNVDFS